MSAMLENAITWFELSQELLNKFKSRPEEIRFLRSACNHLQQTAEFSIKGLLEYFGEEYSKGHDLEENAERLIEKIESMKGMPLGINNFLEPLEWLSSKSGIIIKWEQKPRYDGENFFVKEKTVMECFENVEIIIETIKMLKLL